MEASQKPLPKVYEICLVRSDLAFIGMLSEQIVPDAPPKRRSTTLMFTYMTNAKPAKIPLNKIANP